MVGLPGKAVTRTNVRQRELSELIVPGLRRLDRTVRVALLRNFVP
jgi:hypothetical protein